MMHKVKINLRLPRLKSRGLLGLILSGHFSSLPSRARFSGRECINRNIFYIVIAVSLFSLGRLCLAAEGQPAKAMPRPQEKYEGEELRDPFKDYVEDEAASKAVIKEKEIVKEPERPLPVLKIQGVILGELFNQAIINDKVVKVGDSIEGVSIKDIDRNGITIFFNNQPYLIPSPAATGMPQDTKELPKGGGNEK